MRSGVRTSEFWITIGVVVTASIVAIVPIVLPVIPAGGVIAAVVSALGAIAAVVYKYLSGRQALKSQEMSLLVPMPQAGDALPEKPDAG